MNLFKYIDPYKLDFTQTFDNKLLMTKPCLYINLFSTNKRNLLDNNTIL